MATRNRTAYFKQCRNSAFDQSGRRGPTFKAGYDAGGGIEMGGPETPPFWIVYCNEAEKDMAVIRDLVPELEKLHKNALVDFSDDMETEHEIEVMSGKIAEVFQHCQMLIKKIGHPPQGTKETPDQTKLRHNAQKSLAIGLQDLLGDFRRSQSSYMRRLQGTEERTKQALSGNAVLADDDDFDVADPGFNDDQMMMLVGAERMAEEREQEIVKIAQSINDLAQIFKEMHILVIDQGTILDRIDYNIEQVVTYTEGAHAELVTAEKSQKSYRKKLCILLLIVVVVALVLFLIIYRRPGHNPKPTDSPTPTPTITTTTPTPTPTASGRDLIDFGFADW